MHTPARHNASSRFARIHVQFGLQTSLGMTVVLCILLAYLRTHGVVAIGQCGLVLASGVALGGIVGLWAGRVADAAFWSAIGALCGHLAVLNAYVSHWLEPYVWPMVGAMAGAAAAVGPERPFRRALIAASTAAGLVAAYLAATFGLERGFAAALSCAFLGGAILGLAVEAAHLLEQRVAIPRHVVAIGLVAAAVIGHWAATQLIPAW